ncbi:MAG: NTP transferase domain-containing protein [Anaerolineales bacterium]|nr:NTP transferase domain-containing protein [Anaerolineales bacterium]
MTPKSTRYPVFVLCGSDRKRRKLLRELDPEGRYPSKSLLPFLGKRLMDWQLETLQASPSTGEIYLLGLSPEDAQFDFPVHFLSAEISSPVIDKMLSGLKALEGKGELPELVIISTCDAPGISQESIEFFYQQVSEYPEADVILTGVPESCLKGHFENHGRIVGYFQDQAVFPGELFAFKPRFIREKQHLIRALTDLRRKFNRDGSRVSLGPLIKFLARTPSLWGLIINYFRGKLTIEKAEERIGRAFGIQIKALIIADPGFGMDMDLPEDYARLETYLKNTRLQEE